MPTWGHDRRTESSEPFHSKVGNNCKHSRSDPLSQEQLLELALNPRWPATSSLSACCSWRQSEVLRQVGTPGGPPAPAWPLGHAEVTNVVKKRDNEPPPTATLSTTVPAPPRGGHHISLRACAPAHCRRILFSGHFVLCSYGESPKKSWWGRESGAAHCHSESQQWMRATALGEMKLPS